MGCSCSRDGEICFNNFCNGYDCCVAECKNINNQSVWFMDQKPQQCNSSCIIYSYRSSYYYPEKVITNDLCLTDGLVYNDEYYNVYTSTIFFLFCLTIIFCFSIHRKENTPYIVNARLIDDNTNVCMARYIESTDSDAEEAISVTIVQSNPSSIHTNENANENANEDTNEDANEETNEDTNDR